MEISLVDYVNPVEVNGVVIQPSMCCNFGTFFEGFLFLICSLTIVFKHLPVSPI